MNGPSTAVGAGAGRILLVVHPRAGNGLGMRLAAWVEPELRARGHRVERLVTERPGHARELLRAVELAGCSLVCILGGDGTIHETVDGLLERAGEGLPPLAVVPAGAGNSLATDLGVPDAATAIRRIFAGEEKPVDVARLTVDGRTLHAIHLIGWGAMARIARRANRLRWAGAARYDLASAIELLRPRLPGAAAVLEGERDPGWLLGALCLTRHVGNRVPLAPGAKLDDGRMELVLVRRASRARLLSLLLAAKRGRHLASSLVTLRRVEALRLALAPGSALVVDGETLPAREVRVEMLPRAVRFLA